MNIYEVNTFHTVIHTQYIEANNEEEALDKVSPISGDFNEMQEVERDHEIWLHKENI